MKCFSFLLILLLSTLTFKANAQWQVISTGTGNAFTLNDYPSNFTSYTPGITVTFKANHTVTGAASLNVNGLGPINIYKHGNQPLVSGDIILEQFVTLIFDQSANAFQMTSGLGNNPSSTGWSLGGNSITATDFFGTNNARPIKFTTNSLERMRIATNGDIGIGTTPSNNFALEVFSSSTAINTNNVLKLSSNFGNSFVDLEGSGTSGGEFRIRSSGGTNGIVFQTSGMNDRMRIDASGNVGIGTNSPGERLDVNGSIRYTGALMPGGDPGINGYVLKSNGGGINTWVDPSTFGGSTGWSLTGNSGTFPGINYAGTTDNDFLLKGGTGASIRLNHTANTSAHTASQHVFNTSSSTSPGVIVSGSTYQSSMLNIQKNAAVGTSGMSLGSLTFSASGSAINQAEILALRDLASSGSADIPTALTFWTTPDASSTSLERMRISNAGNVGIGTTNPLSPLSVGTSSQFQVNSTGNIVKINNIVTSFPTTQGPASSYLTNNGTGTLSWTIPPASVTNVTATAPLSSTGGTNPSISLSGIVPIGNGGTNNATPYNLGSVIFSNGTSLTQNNANFFWDNANNRLGIGTAIPLERIDVSGNIKFSGALMPNNLPGASGQVLTSAGPGIPPTWAVASAANVWSLLGNAGTVDGTNFIGTTTNVPLEMRVNNVRAGRIESSNGNTFLGYQAAFSNTGTQNTAHGTQALFSNTSGNFNTAIGSNALNKNTTGGYNSGFGTWALFNNTTGLGNVATGHQALFSTNSGNNNSAFGRDVLYNNTIGDQNVAMGRNALYNNVAGSNAVAIGAFSMANANNTLTAFTNYNVAVGYEALKGSNTPSSNTGNTNTAIGYQSLLSNSSGFGNTATGTWSLQYNTIGTDNTATGYNALNLNTSGTYNTATGSGSIGSNTTGYNNAAHGAQALYSNTTGYENTANGLGALFGNTIGFYNTAMGYSAGQNNTSGTKNTFIGTYADLSGTQRTNATAIGYNAKVDADNSIVLGGTGADAVNVGINTTAPTAKLDVNGKTKTNSLQVTTGAALGYVLTSDASGNATWQSAGGGGSGWNLTGNAGTVDGTNFIGTTDNVPLNFKMNNQKAGRIDVNGNTFFGLLSGNSNTGINNTAYGLNALRDNIAGSSNTAFGVNALRLNNAYDNVAVGSSALNSSTYASQNIAIGRDALFTQSFANGNVTWATDNVAIGYKALYFNQPTSNSNGNKNLSLGSFSLYNNTTGSSNEAIGYEALFKNTIGIRNISIGAQSLYNNIDGEQNIAIGYQSLYSNTSGVSNIAVGIQSLNANTSGYYNSALGISALMLNTTGFRNTSVGQGSLSNNSTGSQNTAIGFNALVNNTTGSRNIAIGDFADVSTGGLTNAIAIGWGSSVGSSNSMVLGATGSNAVNVGIGINAPKSTLDINGAFGTTVKKVTTATTLDNTAAIYYLSGTASTFTLPAASSCPNRRYILVARGVAITVSPSYVLLSTGATSTSVAVNTSIEIISDGTNWLQIR
ncbi:MAG: hypothetical protein H0V01_15325 [Bacteroidetes bacterium]|nr:hypothetical protein [Bacteroidota bacterium]HET6244412.1 hypothetical protein [Bacteroidia bacterium]